MLLDNNNVYFLGEIHVYFTSSLIKLLASTSIRTLNATSDIRYVWEVVPDLTSNVCFYSFSSLELFMIKCIFKKMYNESYLIKTKTDILNQILGYILILFCNYMLERFEFRIL